MERSFAREVEQLELSEGQTFAGEGILAVTKALLQSGVAYVGGYQGSPISHLLDVMVQARPYLDTSACTSRPAPTRPPPAPCSPRPSTTRCAAR